MKVSIDTCPSVSIDTRVVFSQLDKPNALEWLFDVCFAGSTMTRGKRARVPTPVASSASDSTNSDNAASPPGNVSRAPWPRREGLRIPITRHWMHEPKREVLKPACFNRNISEQWDDYDTLYYNAWLEVGIHPTRMTDLSTLSRLDIDGEILRIIKRVGLGTICTKQYDLYPDLVRQFLATARVYYSNEIIPNAREGVLTFFIRGVRYRLSLLDICDIYGFNNEKTGVALPAQLQDAQVYWSRIANGRYDSKTSTQSDVRHPVLRYFVRMIANTLLCKMEPGKMRVHEFAFLIYAVENMFENVCEWPALDEDVNLGAVFAAHLVSLKNKPFQGKALKKKESIGSLLTPIFHFCGIDLTSSRIVTSKPTMDIEYLRHTRWLQGDLLWRFTIPSGPALVRLPAHDLTLITDDISRLSFIPDPVHLVRLPRTRLPRDTPSTIPIYDPGQASTSTTPPTGLPTPPQIPMETAVFQRYVVDSFQSIWSAMTTLSRCGCISSSATAPPPHTRRPSASASSTGTGTSSGSAESSGEENFEED